MAWPWQKRVGDAKDALLEEVILAIGQAAGPSAGVNRETIRPESFIGADLGLSSIGFVRLAGILQRRLGRKPLPFHTLFMADDGSVLQDIRIQDLVGFLDRYTGG
jgi:hypothetical protein